MSKGFCSVPKNQKILTLCYAFLEDADLSLGAKGLYALLYLKGSSIEKLDDLMDYMREENDTFKEYYKELVDNGYIVIKGKGSDLKIELKREVVKKPKDVEKATQQLEESKALIEESQEKVVVKKSKYDEIKEWVYAYTELSDIVKATLMAYFQKWLNSEGRFNAIYLTHSRVDEVIGTLIGMELDDEKMIATIRQSIEKEWANVYAIKGYTKANAGISQFDKTTLESGSWSFEEREQIRARAEQLEKEGKKGYF